MVFSPERDGTTEAPFLRCFGQVNVKMGPPQRPHSLFYDDDDDDGDGDGDDGDDDVVHFTGMCHLMIF